MNSFEANKIFGAVLGTIFVLFGGTILAEGLFHSEPPEKPGYEIVAAEPDANAASQKAPAEDPPVAALLQNASVETGASEFKKCQACHSGEEGGPNKVGPHLWGVVNRPVAHVSDFNYSAGMTAFSDNGSKHWDYDHLYHFLKHPQGYVDGTKMGFAGIKDPQGRADVIAYLRTLSDNPPPLPEAPAEGAGNDETVAQADENPATTTEPGGETQNAGAQASGVTDADSAQAAPGSESAPTMSDGEQPNPPATNMPQGDSEAKSGGSANGNGQTAPSDTGNQQGQAAGGSAAAASASQPQAAETQTAAVTGDIDAGSKVFKRCQACHAVGPDAKNKIGPALNGIVGEQIAEVEGYTFSSALQKYGEAHGKWNVAELTQWLQGPQKLVPGTKMAFPGLNKPEDIANVIAYLNSFNEAGEQTK